MRSPRGLVLNESFREYLQRFRARYPLDIELAAEHGWLTDTSYLTNPMTQTASGSNGGSA